MTVSVPVMVAAFAGGLPSPAQASPQLAPRTGIAPPVPEPTPQQVAAGAAKLAVGSSGPAVREVQRRLALIGIPVTVTGTFDQVTARAVRHFHWKFTGWPGSAVDRRAWNRIMRVSSEGDRIPDVCTRKRHRKALCADKKLKVLRYFRNGRLVRTYDARFGGFGYPTGEGRFRIKRKVADEYSRTYGSYMPWAMYFNGGEAVHWSGGFKKIGYAGASHGCINLKDKAGARWLFRRIPVGTLVVVYR